MSPIPISPDDIAEMRDEYEQGQINDDPMILFPILEQAHQERVNREYQLACRISDLQKERDKLQQRLAKSQKIVDSWAEPDGDGWTVDYLEICKLAAALAGKEGG